MITRSVGMMVRPLIRVGNTFPYPPKRDADPHALTRLYLMFEEGLEGWAHNIDRAFRRFKLLDKYKFRRGPTGKFIEIYISGGACCESAYRLTLIDV